MPDPKQGSSVLVTGGTGFLGQYVVASLLETGYAVRDRWIVGSFWDEKGKRINTREHHADSGDDKATIAPLRDTNAYNPFETETQRPVLLLCLSKNTAPPPPPHRGSRYTKTATKFQKTSQVTVLQSSAAKSELSHPRVTRAVGNLATGAGLQNAIDTATEAAVNGRLAAVINCAAISFPGECETRPSETESVNVPSMLVDNLCRHAQSTGWAPLLVQLSTDQVYGDSRGDAIPSLWRETDAIAPVNVYGAQKADAEGMIEARYPHHVILRSSVMYGPLPELLGPVKGERFLQFCNNVLDGKSKVAFFDDEWRNFVSVTDVAAAVSASVRLWPPVKIISKEGSFSGGDLHSFFASNHVISVEARTGSDEGTTAAGGNVNDVSSTKLFRRRRAINVAGPERMSRADFARALARARGLPRNAVKTVSVRVGGTSRPMTSPSDSSVDVAMMQDVLGVKPKSVAEVLEGLLGRQ